jgi:uncharacterized LabA/DUF88 family protein
MNQEKNNFAYIDGANLHKGVAELDWKLDYKRFREWLRDKYNIQNAYLFIGLVPNNKDLYTSLQEMGYLLVYKEVTYDGTGKVKGNCDAELVLKAIVDYYEKRFNKAVIVASDGDYACLVKFLKEKNVFLSLISPSNKCSYLLRKLNIPIVYLDMKKNKFKRQPHNEKAPVKDEP